VWFAKGREPLIGSVRLMNYGVAARRSFFIGVIVGGFCLGFVSCESCGDDMLERVFIGLVSSVLTPMFAGFLPQNGANVGKPYNAWPYIVPAWAFFFALDLWLQARKSAKA
jgi:hypothetical protein